eukprot:3460651-Prymnesium_polylepis.1
MTHKIRRSRSKREQSWRKYCEATQPQPLPRKITCWGALASLKRRHEVCEALSESRVVSQGHEHRPEAPTYQRRHETSQ